LQSYCAGRLLRYVLARPSLYFMCTISGLAAGRLAPGPLATLSKAPVE